MIYQEAWKKKKKEIEAENRQEVIFEWCLSEYFQWKCAESSKSYQLKLLWKKKNILS